MSSNLLGIKMAYRGTIYQPNKSILMQFCSVLQELFLSLPGASVVSLALNLPRILNRLICTYTSGGIPLTTQ